MIRKVFTYSIGPDQPLLHGTTLQPWDYYVRMFFQRWPHGEPVWLRDEQQSR